MKLTIIYYSFVLQIFVSLSDKVSNQITQILDKHFSTCEIVFVDIDEHKSLTFSSTSLSPLPFQYSQSTGNFIVRSLDKSDKTGIFYRLKDIHRYQIQCGVALIFIRQTRINLPTWLFETVTPRYVPIIRKDVDYFIFVFVNEEDSTEVLNSHSFGQKIRFKLGIISDPNDLQQPQYNTVHLYKNNGQSAIIPINLDSSLMSNITDLFPDSTQNMYGRELRVAKTSTNNHFEMEPFPNGKGFRATRGSYKFWLEFMMNRFNFTITLFLSSLSGGTGKLLPNGTWQGAVADILYEKADIATYVGHIYNRHPFVDWSTPLSYEWMLFITHKPKTFYSPSAIIHAFPAILWLGFVISAFLICITLKLISKYFSTLYFSYKGTFGYLLATCLEQDAQYYLSMLQLSSVRILVVFWLLFTIVLSTAYRGKLVSLIAFPGIAWVPETMDELAHSHYHVGVNVLGKGGAAYTVFSTSKHPVYQTIFKKMEIYSDAAKCLKEGLTNDIGCIMWISVARYTLHKNFTDKFGRNPFRVAQNGYSFIEDGFVWEKRAVFRQNFDRITWALLERGVIEYWVLTDYNEVKRKNLHERKRHSNDPDSSELYGDAEAANLELIHLKGLFIIMLTGHLFSFLAFIAELFRNRIGLRSLKRLLKRSAGNLEDDSNAFCLNSAEDSHRNISSSTH